MSAARTAASMALKTAGAASVLVGSVMFDKKVRDTDADMMARHAEYKNGKKTETGVKNEGKKGEGKGGEK